MASAEQLGAPPPTPRRPVWLELEPHFQLHLAQAKSNRAPRGRKSDFGDSRRLVRRFVAGELILSYVPEPAQRAWRSLTRNRQQLVRDKVRLQNQMECLLGDARIKLSSVITDLLGVSGRRILSTPDRPPVPCRYPGHLREYERLGTVSLLAGLDLHSGRIMETVSDTHPLIAQLGQLARVGLTGCKRAQDSTSANPKQIGDHAGQPNPRIPEKTCHLVLQSYFVIDGFTFVRLSDAHLRKFPRAFLQRSPPTASNRSSLEAV